MRSLARLVGAMIVTRPNRLILPEKAASLAGFRGSDAALTRPASSIVADSQLVASRVSSLSCLVPAIEVSQKTVSNC